VLVGWLIDASCICKLFLQLFQDITHSKTCEKQDTRLETKTQNPKQDETKQEYAGHCESNHTLITKIEWWEMALRVSRIAHAL